MAWAIAIAADGIQIAVLPFFAGGVSSPADIAVDAAVALILSRLVGWHWAFLPTFAAELIPGFDLFPTWTAALSYVTLRRAQSVEPEVYPRDFTSTRSLNS